MGYVRPHYRRGYYRNGRYVKPSYVRGHYRNTRGGRPSGGGGGRRGGGSGDGCSEIFGCFGCMFILTIVFYIYIGIPSCVSRSVGAAKGKTSDDGAWVLTFLVVCGITYLISLGSNKKSSNHTQAKKTQDVNTTPSPVSAVASSQNESIERTIPEPASTRVFMKWNNAEHSSLTVTAYAPKLGSSLSYREILSHVCPWSIASRERMTSSPRSRPPVRQPRSSGGPSPPSPSSSGSPCHAPPSATRPRAAGGCGAGRRGPST